MTEQESQALNILLDMVRTNTDSDFYRTQWRGEEVFSALPTVSRREFIATPLSMRRYKTQKGIVKIVHDGTDAFLSEWSFADIGKESFGLPAQRPMVYMTDPHEAIEKSMWCYEQNMLPLIGEKDPEIAMHAASRYRIDSLITDVHALRALTPFLARLDSKPRSISILGDVFPTEELLAYRDFAETVRLVRALPEVGAFAEATLSASPQFQTLPGCIVEHRDRLIVTKLSHLTTPVIRYRTTISANV